MKFSISRCKLVVITIEKSTVNNELKNNNNNAHIRMVVSRFMFLPVLLTISFCFTDFFKIIFSFLIFV